MGACAFQWTVPLEFSSRQHPTTHRPTNTQYTETFEHSLVGAPTHPNNSVTWQQQASHQQIKGSTVLQEQLHIRYKQIIAHLLQTTYTFMS